MNETKYNLLVTVKGWEDVKRPVTDSCGEDNLLCYYCEKDCYFCEVKSGREFPAASIYFTAEMKEIVVSLNTELFPASTVRLDFIFQILPLAKILQFYHAMVLHSSQIKVQDKGILFTAPSGHGKTTQANLWNRYVNAEKICNDRTIIRCFDGCWYTFGLPIDGSEPIYSNEMNRLDAIIILGKSKDNKLRRLSARQSISYLMNQTLITAADRSMIYTSQMNWLDILQGIPIYMYSCRADESAVEYLKKQLQEDGILE